MIMVSFLGIVLCVIVSLASFTVYCTYFSLLCLVLGNTKWKTRVAHNFTMQSSRD